MIREIGHLDMHAAKSETTTGNDTGVDLQDYVSEPREMAAHLSVGAASGTTPTLDVKIQESDDNITFTDISGAAFTQATAATNETIYFRTTKRYVRTVHTLAGTSPNFSFSVVANAIKHFA